MKFNLKDTLKVLLITAGVSLIGNYISKDTTPLEALPGMLILVAIAFAGIALGEIIPIKLPNIAYIMTIGTILTVPGFPGSATIINYVGKIDFLALCTPILAYAGIYTGKSIDDLKKTGWRIFVLAVVVMFATFVGSAVIAQFVLKFMGQI